MTASILTILSSPEWLSFWEVVEFVSIIIVGVGCWGEVWSEHHKFSPKPNDLMPPVRLNKKWERKFWLMVLGGLCIELVAFGFSFLASNREIEALHKDNAELFKVGEYAKASAARAASEAEKAKTERLSAEKEV